MNDMSYDFCDLCVLYENTPNLVAIFDQSDKLTMANDAFRAAYHLEPQEFPFWADFMRRNYKRGVGSAIQTADIDTWLISALSRRGKVPFRAFEAELRDGRWIWMTETVDPRGFMMCMASDITTLKPGSRTIRKDRDMALRDAQTDPLTGVSNRRLMFSRLETLIRDSAATDAPFCLAILDIDLFKGVNDRFGHVTGDEVLRDFARCAQSAMRRGDFFGRIGGEEFMILFPDVHLDMGLAISNSILETIRQPRTVAGMEGFFYTCSVGLAVVIPGETDRELYARADHALYRAKQTGRDQVCLAE